MKNEASKSAATAPVRRPAPVTQPDTEPGAAQWQLAPLDAAVTQVAFDENVPGLLYAVAADGVYVSRDDGASFEYAADLTGTLVTDPSEPGAAYIGSSTVWKTTDSGTTWEELAGLPGTGRRAVPLIATHDGALYVRVELERPCSVEECGTSDGGEGIRKIPFDGVAVSNDGGKTWRERECALQAEARAASPYCGTIVSFAPGLTYRIDPLSRTLELNGTRLNQDEASAPWSLASLRLDKQSSGTLYALVAQAAGVETLIVRSTDGGRSWTSAPLTTEGTPLKASSIATDDVDGRLYASARIGDGPPRLYVSTDRGTSFTAAQAGLPAGKPTQVVPVPHVRCAALALVDGAVYRTSNGGGSCAK